MPVAYFPPTPCPVCISRRPSHSSDLPPSVLCRLHYRYTPGERTLKRTTTTNTTTTTTATTTTTTTTTTTNTTTTTTISTTTTTLCNL